MIPRLSLLTNQAANPEKLNKKFIAAINSDKPIESILGHVD